MKKWVRSYVYWFQICVLRSRVWERSRFDVDVIEFVRYYSSLLDTWDLSLLSIPEGENVEMEWWKDQFSMDVLDQHNQLYERVLEAKEELDPIVNLINRRENLLQLKEELDVLLKDPRRYTDKRNSNK